MSTIESPNKRYRLTVHAETNHTDSGPVTYYEAHYHFVVTDAAGATVAEHRAMHAWDDTASRGNYGVSKWALTNTHLELTSTDGKVERVPLTPAP